MAYSDLAIDNDTVEAFEPGLDLGAELSASTVSVVRGLLRDRLRERLMPVIKSVGTTETAFYDAMQALAATHDVHVALKRFLTIEALHTYWRGQQARPMRGNLAKERAEFFDGYLNAEQAGFVDMVRTAVGEDEITTTATRSEVPDEPLWAI